MTHKGRIACIFIPYVLTLASLVCIIIVGLGCIKPTSGALSEVYFLRVNLQNVSNGTQSISKIENILHDRNITSIDSEGISEIVSRIQSNSTGKDFYQIGLWGYCDGEISSGNYELTNCSQPKSVFYFDPLSVWRLKNDSVVNGLPKGYHRFSNTYKALLRWMSIAYILAFVTTILEIAIGALAILSRWGSCVTTIVAVVALLFTAAASATSTTIFVLIRSTAGPILAAYGIHLSIGKHILAATWMATFFSMIGLMYWTCSVCCCSGRDSHARHPKIDVTNNIPHIYEPLGAGTTSHSPPQANWPSYQTSPVTSSHPMYALDRRANAQEPFRHY
ncbi:uncharacterized protein N7511_000192 [Penicillium nucicola]|uniref:uncharacterized protein n=1 Tax=Penicillium nucicola TaxID=1850975 RepID=UPI0025459F4F|nr:uncharacterized protein N7511_000192 [Penicillium nucicola]KAJ5775181.1 hypothetical protein N7511_000192 [Penicillium nucicola]